MEDIQVGLSLGGNLGNVRETLHAAQQAITRLKGIYHARHSTLYQTDPISLIEQPAYLNAATVFTTTLSAWSLLEQLQTIEQRLGKRKKAREAPRHIDIDIIYYGVHQIEHPNLQLPHPRWQDRLFVVAPLSDLISKVPHSDGSVNLFTLRKALAAQASGVLKLDPKG